MVVDAEAASRALAQAAAPEGRRVTNATLRGASLEDATVFGFDLSPELAARVAEDVRAAALALVEKVPVAYDPSYATDAAQVMIEALDAVPQLAAADQRVLAGGLTADEGGDDLVAMAHGIGSGPRRITAYRTKGAGIAARRKKARMLVPREGVYEEVQGDVLYYEPRFDVLTCGGYAFFTNVSVIQDRLHADGKARELARTTLGDLTGGGQRLPIEGYAQLEEAVMEDRTLRAKMAAVARKVADDPEYARHLTTENLVLFAEEHPEYGIPLAGVGADRRLRFDPAPKHRHQIPKLLADDYLMSELTQLRYEAGSKQLIPPG